MTYSLINKCAKNYYNRTFIVQVIAKNVVTCFFLRHSVDSSTSMTLNHQKRGFGDFLQFLAAVHNSTVNCNEMAGDRPKQPACEIFSIER